MKVKLTILVVSSIVGFFLGEIAIRVFHLEYYRRHHRIFGEYAPTLGWRLKRNFEGWHKTREYTVHEAINSLGIRGPEIVPVWGKPRVLMLGDSFTEGYTVSLRYRLSEVLAETCDIQVINAGVGGYSTDQELLWWRIEGKRLEPNAVIVMWCDNDLLSNATTRIHRGNKPRFVIQPGPHIDTPTTNTGGLQLTNVPVPLPRPPVWHIRLRGSSQIYMHLRGRIWRRPQFPPAWNIFKVPPDERTEDAWRITERILQDLYDDVGTAVGTRKSKLLVCAIPPRPAIYPDVWKATVEHFGFTVEQYDVRRIAKRLAMICERNGIPFLDLYEPMIAAVKTGERLHFKKDGHWTTRGHRIAAEILAQWWNQSGFGH